MDLNYKLIGKRIRKLRKAKKWTQEDMCFKVNVSKTHMSHVENGTTKLSLPLLVSIANAVGTTPDGILCDSVQASTPVFKKEIENIINDCSPYELRAMIAAMSLVKDAIRNCPGSHEEIYK